tara:strand:+ start:1938 stop:2117 length:180 start_codon:yes stop_codon:yes gene_type:complete
MHTNAYQEIKEQLTPKRKKRKLKMSEIFVGGKGKGKKGCDCGYRKPRKKTTKRRPKKRY